MYHTDHGNAPQAKWANSERHLGPAGVRARLLLLISATKLILGVTNFARGLWGKIWGVTLQGLTVSGVGCRVSSVGCKV